MSDFNKMNLSGATIGNLQQGDWNTIYNGNQQIGNLCNQDWNILEYELQNIKKSNSNSFVINETLHMVRNRNKDGIKRIWKDKMASFIRDVVVNLTADGLIVLFSKILI